MKTLRIFALCLLASTNLLMAQAPATPRPGSHPAKATAQAAPPSTADIADAKAKGLVWVNLNTKVYHQAGASQYGTTKHGKFMTEADAKAAGYRAAKDTSAKSAKTPAPKNN